MPDFNPANTAFWAWLGTQVGFGTLTGWCVGFAAKKLTYLVAIALGLVFIVLQVMVVNGWVTVNWMGIQQEVQRQAPRMSQLWTILTANFPYGGAFLVGFLLGFRKG